LDLDTLTTMLLDFVRTHQGWAPLIVGLLAFAESLAVVSLLVPSTVLLLGIGALIGASGLEFWPFWLGAAVGAILEDWLSYAIAFRFKHAVFRVWPLSSHQSLSDRGEQFFARWGAWGVFLGRFIGPMRALTAGIFAMPMLLFQTATIASAFVWAFIMLAPGAGLTALAKGHSGKFFAGDRIKAEASFVYRAWIIPEDEQRSSPATKRGPDAQATGAAHRHAYAVSPLSLGF